MTNDLEKYFDIVKGNYVSNYSSNLEGLLGTVRGFFSSRASILFLNTSKGYIVLARQGCSLDKGTRLKGDLKSALEKKYCINGGQWYLTHLSSNGKPFGTVAIHRDKDQPLSSRLEESFSGLLSLYVSKLFDNLYKTRQLQETGETYKTVLEGISSAIITSDLNGKIISCNQVAAEVYGWKRGEILGKDIGTFLSPLSKNPFPFFMRKLHKQGSWKNTTIGLKKDGSRLLQEFTLVLLKDANNKPLGLVAEIADITEKERKEQCQEVLESINKAVVSSLNIGRIIETFARELHKVVDFDGLELILFEKVTRQHPLEHYTYPPAWKKLVDDALLERAGFKGMGIPRKALSTHLLEGSPLGKRLYRKGIRSYLLYPVDYLEKKMGILLLLSKKKARFRRRVEWEVLSRVTPLIILAIQNAKIRSNLKTHLEQLKRLCLVTSELTKEIESPDQLFQKIAQGAASLFSGSKALVCLAHWGSKPQVVANSGLNQKFIEKFLHLGHKTCPCDIVRTQKHPTYLSTILSEKKTIRRSIQTLIKKAGMESWLSVPIKGKGENIGCISLFFTGNFIPESFYLKLLEMFAFEAAAAINNAQLYRKLQESEKLYKELYDQAPCMYYSLNESGFILKCNNAGARCLGYRKEELLGRHFFDLLEGRSLPTAVLNNTLEGGLSECELSFITKEGNNLHTTVQETQTCVAGRKETRVVLTDITEKKKLYERLSQTEKLTAVGQLASGMAHDFNNFLTIILGNLHIAEEQNLEGSELKECLRIMKKACLDGAETVRRLKEFTNIRADSTKFVPLDINHVLKEVINYTKHRWKAIAQAKGVTYYVRLAKATSTCWVLGNPTELKEVFLNIVNNALDAMPEGGNLTVKVCKENGRLAISIKDTGIGMVEEVRKRVFDPFFTTKGVEGSGLGMSVAYGIIKRHRGETKVESQEGVGTTVVVKLPLAYQGIQEVLDVVEKAKII